MTVTVVILSILTIANLIAALYFKAKYNLTKEELEDFQRLTNMDFLDLIERNAEHVNKLERKWEEELQSYQLTVDNLKLLKTEVDTEVPKTTKRKPKK